MNYLHSKYAGNYGDVFKHLIHLGILEQLQSNPMHYIESHAGAAAYSLTNNDHHLNGIAKLWQYRKSATALSPLIKNYLSIVDSVNPTKTLQNYPGSPIYAQRTLNQSAALFLNEINPEIFEQLKQNTKADHRAQPFLTDGYEQSIKQLEQLGKIKQNYILLDPPYVEEQDFNLVLKTVDRLLQMDPKAVIAIWYPMLNTQSFSAFYKTLINYEKMKTMKFEYRFPDEQMSSKTKMKGCGMLVFNMPPQAEYEINSALEEFEKILVSE